FVLPFREPENSFSAPGMPAAPIGALAVIGGGGWLCRGPFLPAQHSDPLERALPVVLALLNPPVWVDGLYAASFGRLTGWLAGLWAWLDREVIGRLVEAVGALTEFLGQVNFIADDALLNDGADAVASGTVASGDRARRSETGKVQDYLAIAFAGAVPL